MLIIASWYQTREHPSRSLIFQSANAGYGVIGPSLLNPTSARRID